MISMFKKKKSFGSQGDDSNNHQALLGWSKKKKSSHLSSVTHNTKFLTLIKNKKDSKTLIVTVV